MLHLPRPGRRARLFALPFGLALLLWLSLEDTHIWPVALLGLGLSALLNLFFVLDKLGGQAIPRRYALPLAALAGVLIGLGASIAAAGLMFFKNALHAHVFLDFPPGLMLAMLERAPAWALAGGLFGLGLALIGLMFSGKAP
ncbi:MAG: hypothetical protein HXY41_08815 [Chloroflexi bacterium]|nr:hypothetical protein [Chloroflexota bacterium]